MASDLTGVGGIQRYSRALLAALGSAYEVDVADLRLDGSRRRRVLAMAVASARLAVSSPDCIVFTHPRLARLGWICAARRIPCVTLVYGVEVWGARSQSTARALSRATSIWSISEFTSAQMERRYGRGADIVVLAGVDERFFAIDKDPSDVFRVLVVARLDDLYYKGIDLVLDAVKSLAGRHRCHLTVVGRGQQERDLRDMVVDRGMDDLVEVRSGLDDVELLHAYSVSDVVVLTSRFSDGSTAMGEGLGLTLLEASAGGIATVGSAEDGSAEVVLPGVTGLLVKPSQPGSVEAALEALATDRGRCREMGDRGRLWARDTWSMAAYGERVRAAMESVLDGSGSGR